MHEGHTLGKKEMLYNEYFTVSGVFLSYKFKKGLEQVVEETEKVSN